MTATWPDPQPSLRAGSLHLVPYVEGDAVWVSEQAGELDVARHTGLPHPMDRSVASEWIRCRREGFEKRTNIAWAVRLPGADGAPGEPIGSGSVRTGYDPGIIILGFWLGKGAWGQGHGSQIAARLVRFAFEDLGARRVEADCADVNGASARALVKAGLEPEGRRRGAFHRFDATHDLLLFGAVRPAPTARGRP